MDDIDQTYLQIILQSRTVAVIGLAHTWSVIHDAGQYLIFLLFVQRFVFRYNLFHFSKKIIQFFLNTMNMHFYFSYLIWEICGFELTLQ